MAEEKVDVKENDINDGYQYIKEGSELLASGQKRDQQGGQDHQISDLITVNRNNNIDIIQKCIGQLTISYDNEKDANGKDKYRYGTATVYKHLDGKYYLALTCGHNLVFYNDETSSKQNSKKLFYLPHGTKEEKNRLQCIEWIAHEKYNPRIDHCQYDIGIILCYDARKHYKKSNTDVNENIRIGNWNKDQLKNCSIFGYPVRGKGHLMGAVGKAKKDDEENGKWIYRNISTYPGQSGSILYKESDDDDRFTIYGVHIFGDMDKQFNRGVKLNDNHIKWIKNKEQLMVHRMNQHKETKKSKKKKTDTDLKTFLVSIDLEKYHNNFTKQGCDSLIDFKEADINDHDLQNTFSISNWRDRTKILKEAQKYFGSTKPMAPTKPMEGKYKYISSLMCLKTTDSAIETCLLKDKHNYIYKNDEIIKLSLIKKNDETNQVLAELSNVFTTAECSEIIKNAKKYGEKAFQDMAKTQKYDDDIRKSDRLLAIDENVSNILEKRLTRVINEQLIKKYNVSTTPLGFGVIDDKWTISRMNYGIRINRYNANNKDFFTLHKDGQFVPSANERSLFTLIVYLNDDFSGGETKFYFEFENTMNDLQAATIQEEIKHQGGMSGYISKTISPKTGNGIIFSQNIIHEGCPLQSKMFWDVTCKYILKTDVLVKRIQSDNTKKKFAISTEESLDYERCINYFTEAQSNELKFNTLKANELYERSLFIRYSYPRKLILKPQKPKSKLVINIDSVWLVIFDYCHAREVECVSLLFPDQLYHLMCSWKLLFNNDKMEENNDLENAKYIPKLITSHGCYHILEFSDYDFFMSFQDDCCRVAAIYALFLMSHSEKNQYFIAQYDPNTQNVMAVELHKLLQSVFYQRQCHGTYFKIKHFQKHESITENDRGWNAHGVELIRGDATDMSRYFSKDLHRHGRHADGGSTFDAHRNPSVNEAFDLNVERDYFDKDSDDFQQTKAFDLNIDRDYMRIVHGAQFIGGDLLLTNQKYSCKLAANVLKFYYGHRTLLIDFATSRSTLGSFQSFGVKVIKKQYNTSNFERQKYNKVKQSDDTVELKSLNLVDDDIENKSNYLNDLIKIKENSNDNGCGNCALLSAYGIIPCPDSGQGNIDPKRDVNYYNHLIFDFNKYELIVKEEKTNTDCGLCLPLNEIIKKTDTNSELSVKYNIVDIESLFKNAKYSLSYNHAGCATCGDSGLLAADIDAYLGSNNIKHVHIASMRTTGNKVKVWVSYNGFSAM